MADWKGWQIVPVTAVITDARIIVIEERVHPKQLEITHVPVTKKLHGEEETVASLPVLQKHNTVHLISKWKVREKDSLFSSRSNYMSYQSCTTLCLMRIQIFNAIYSKARAMK